MSYNLALGGRGGKIALFKDSPRYEDICNKISMKLKGNKKLSEKAKEQHKNKNIGMYNKKHTEYTKEKIGKGHRGKKVSQSTIDKIKQSQQKTFSDPEYTHPNRGVKKSAETIQKIKDNRACMKGSNNPRYGCVVSESTKKKISESNKSKPKIKCEYCGKMSNKGNYRRWHGTKCKQKESLL